MKSIFDAPGLTGESFYRTRRSNLRATMIVLFGVCGALYAGVVEVMRLVNGVRSVDPAFGLSDYMVEVIKAVAVAALVGAALSWPAGYLWERRHRARRGSQPAT